MPAQWNLFSRLLLAACAMHALCSVGAEVTEPSNCSPARGHIRASSFYRDSGPSSQIYDTHSVSAILMYNGEDTELPVYFEGNGYDIAIPESQGDTVACLHLELRDKKNASIVFQRTQSIAFWVLSSEYDAALWRPQSHHIDMMVKLAQHLKGRGELHDAMQASRCAFDTDQQRTFQNVGARIEFICALAALSPSQQPHIKEALELATQLQVHSAHCERDDTAF